MADETGAEWRGLPLSTSPSLSLSSQPLSPPPSPNSNALSGLIRVDRSVRCDVTFGRAVIAAHERLEEKAHADERLRHSLSVARGEGTAFSSAGGEPHIPPQLSTPHSAAGAGVSVVSGLDSVTVYRPARRSVNAVRVTVCLDRSSAAAAARISSTAESSVDAADDLTSEQIGRLLRRCFVVKGAVIRLSARRSLHVCETEPTAAIVCVTARTAITIATADVAAQHARSSVDAAPVDGDADRFARCVLPRIALLVAVCLTHRVSCFVLCCGVSWTA
jgi:hypothetical protein